MRRAFAAILFVVCGCTVEVYDRRPVVGVDTVYVEAPPKAPKQVVALVKAFPTLFADMPIANYTVLSDSIVEVEYMQGGVTRRVVYHFDKKAAVWMIVEAAKERK